MDLSHWNLFDSFTAHEAACLATGVDPALSNISPEDEARISVIERRINEAFDNALVMAHGFNSQVQTEKSSNHREIIEGYIHWGAPGYTIISNDLYRNMSDCIHQGRCYDPNNYNYSGTKYGGHILHEWFKNVKFNSVYKFFQDNEYSNNNNNNQSKNEKPLSTTERSSLLTIIAALCDCSAIDINQRGAAKRIEEITEEFGYRVSNDTISRVIKQIPEVLEARSK